MAICLNCCCCCPSNCCCKGARKAKKSSKNDKETPEGKCQKKSPEGGCQSPNDNDIKNGNEPPVKKEEAKNGKKALAPQPPQKDNNDDEPIYAVVKKDKKRSHSTGSSGVQCTFLVSFLVDTRGGVMRGSRGSGLRIFFPEGAVLQPTRITCKFVRAKYWNNVLALLPGDQLVSGVVELGPSESPFLHCPALLELPHHLGREECTRHELIVLRSDDGEHWREHDPKHVHCESAWSGQDEEIYDQVMSPVEAPGAEEDLATTRIVRMSLHKSCLPRYVCLISRVPNAVGTVGAEGGSVQHETVKVTFPEGAILHTIKVGVSARKLVNPQEVAKRMLPASANMLMEFGPVITLSPGGRKFRKPIRISMDASVFTKAHLESESAKVLVFCSMSVAEENSTGPGWEDVTEKIGLQKSKANNRLAFESKVSGRFWLVLQRAASSSPPFTPKEASLLYKELQKVNYVASLTVFYCSHFPKAWFDTVRVYIRLGRGAGGGEKFMEENIAISNEPWKVLIERCDMELRNDTRYEAHLEGNLGFAPDVAITSDFVFRPPGEVALTLVTRQLEGSLPKTGHLVFREKQGKSDGGRPHSTWRIDTR